MTINVTTPVTGSAQTGFTAPTYTVVQDIAPAQNAKQWAVTALGGTQAGVIPHSVSAPFTVASFRPQNPQVLKPVNAVTGVLNAVPMNVYKTVVRKGVLPLAGQAYKNLVATLVLEIPAGSDTADPANVRAALSLLFGVASQQSAGIGDTCIQGTM